MTTGRVMLVLQPRIGGVPRYVLDLAAGLAQRQWSVCVVGPPAPALAEEFARVSASYVPFVRDPGRSPSPAADVAAIRTIVQACRTFRPDVLHSHSTKAGMLGGIGATIVGVPSVFTPHAWSFQMGDQSRYRGGALKVVEAFMSRVVHSEVVAICTSERDVAVSAAVVNRKHVSVVPTGFVPPSHTPPSREVARAALGIPATATVVAWIGRDAPQKQPAHVARLAGCLGDSATVVALGNDLEGSPAGDAIQSAGGRVAPAHTRADDLRAASDIYVQTSAWEGLPLTVLEAAGAGLPVVSYDVGGIHEQVIDGVSGHLVEPGDVAALVERVRSLVDDPQTRTRMGDAGRRHVESAFSRTTMLDGIERRYAAVLDGAGRRALEPEPTTR